MTLLVSTFFIFQFNITQKTFTSSQKPPQLCSYQSCSIPNYPGIGDLPRDLILYFVTPKELWVLPGTVGDLFFLVSPLVGPHPTILGEHLGQRYNVDLAWGFTFVLCDVQGIAQGMSWVCGDTIFCKSPGKSLLQPAYCPASFGRGYN